MKLHPSGSAHIHYCRARRKWIFVTIIVAGCLLNWQVATICAQTAFRFDGSGNLTNAAPIIPGPPTITATPANQVVTSGDAVAFSVAAVGPGPLSYQWLYSGLALAGATNDTLFLPRVTGSGSYRVVVANGFGSITSSPAFLTLAPVVVYDNTRNLAGSNHWDASEFGDQITLATNHTERYLTECVLGLNVPSGFTNAFTLQLRLYRNDGVSGAPGTLLYTSSLLPVPRANDYNLRLALDCVPVSDTFTWTVQFSGDTTNWPGVNWCDPPSVGSSSANSWWQKIGGNWNLISTITNGPGNLEASFSAVRQARIPFFTNDASRLTVRPGSNVSFQASASGLASLNYQWLLNGATLANSARIAGVTTTNLSINAAQGSDAGRYTLAALLNSAGTRTNVVSSLSVLPAPWWDTDIGALAFPGWATFNAGACIVQADGADIWDMVDGLHFVYQALSGDGEIVGRVTSLQNTTPWAKAGLMMRESLTRSARHAMIEVTSGNGTAFQRRTNESALSLSTGGGDLWSAPCWLKLARLGDTLYGFKSLDGATWTLVGSDTVAMSNAVYVGLALTSHAYGTVNTATFDQVQIVNPPDVVTQPMSVVTLAGQAATFTIGAVGVGPLGYQWQFNGTNLTDNGRVSGSSAKTLNIANLLASDAGNYRVIITNAFGTALGQATLAVHPTVANAGTLHVELLATDPSAGSAVWTNRGDLGDFTRYGNPDLVSDVLGTGIPGLLLRTSNYWVGPLPGSDLSGSSDRSVEVWALNPSVEQDETMVSWGHRGIGDAIWAHGFGSSPYWGSGTTWDQYHAWPSPQSVPSPGRWHHLVKTFNGGNNIRYYVDGVLVIDQTMPNSINTLASDPILVGGQWDTDGATEMIQFTGYVNAVRIHGGVLSPGQVASNYLAGPWRPPGDLSCASPEHGAVSQFYPHAGSWLVDNLAGAVDFMQDTPAATSYLTNLLEGVTNKADFYGERIMALITPPQSGPYTFWISGDDACNLYLSSSENQADKSLIASVPDATGFRSWMQETNQQSVPVPLTAGQRYYLEVLHVEGFGADHVSVAWQWPDGTFEAPISASRLTPVNPPLFNSVTQGVCCEVYEGYLGANLSDFTNHAFYLNHQYSRLRFQPTGFDVRNAGLTYGARMQALFIPPATGNYTFWLSGDDESTLSLSSDGNPDHRQLIASVIWSGYRSWTNSSAQRSAPVTLQSGQPCYLEVLHKQDWGDDHVTVRVQLPDGTIEEPINPSRLLPYSLPVVAHAPQTQTAQAGNTVTLSTLASGLPPFTYQWWRNGVAVAGATNASLVLSNIQAVAAGAYTVVVANPLGQATNGVTTVEVQTVAAPLPPGCVAWWRAENNFLDSAGTNHGFGSNGLTFAAGKVGQSFSLDGTNDFVNAGAVDLPGTFTIEGWINLQDITTTHYLIAKGGGGLKRSYDLAVFPAGILYGTVSASGIGNFTRYYPTSARLTPGAWTHVAMTYLATNGAGRRIQLYLNGVSVPTSVFGGYDSGGEPFHDTNTLKIGVFSDASSQFFRGQIDELALYNRVLSSNEIAAIWLAASAGKLAVGGVPSIIAQPQSQTNSVGAAVTFSVSATGAGTLTYQWYKSVVSGTWSVINGATNSALSLQPLALADGGGYRVVVTHSLDSVTSSVATLTVYGLLRASPTSKLNPNGSFDLSWEGGFGTVALETSTNLTDWAELMRGMAASGVQTFTDGQAASQTRRFYRLRMVTNP